MTKRNDRDLGYDFGEILLASMAFGDGSGAKRRPVLAIRDGGDEDLLAVPITSRRVRSRFDIPLVDWRGEGLRLPSIARLEKLAAIDKSLVLRRLGRLTNADRRSIHTVSRELFDEIAP